MLKVGDRERHRQGVDFLVVFIVLSNALEYVRNVFIDKTTGLKS